MSLKIESITMDGLGLDLDPSDRVTILLALQLANEAVELEGEDVVIDMVLDDGTNKYNINLLVDRIMELDELINKHTMTPALYDWMESIDVNERTPELPRLDGMSWVHMSVKDELELEVIGWVTACIMPDPDRYKALKISFAFGMSNCCFSKRLGRIVSRDRYDIGKCFTVNAGASDRYSSVQSLIRDIVGGQTLTTVIEDLWGNTFPGWMTKDRVRKDIPEDIRAFMESLHANGEIDPLTSRTAGKLLGYDVEFKGIFSQVRDS